MSQFSPQLPSRETIGEARSLSRDGRQIGYHVAGSGAPILLSASAGREVSDFNELAKRLHKAGYRTLAVDAPGIGASEMPDTGLELADLSDDLKAVLDIEASDEQIVAIGHAFGNRVVRMLANRNPKSVRGVALLAAGGLAPVPREANHDLQGCFNTSMSSTAHEAAIRSAFFADGNTVPGHWRRGWYGRTAALQSKANWPKDDGTWMAAGGVPILVLQAEHDRIAPARDAGNALKLAYPKQVELITVPQSGHAMLPEQPVFIAREIKKFIQSLD